MQTNVIEGFRLSPQQRHLWSLQQASGDELPYRAQCAVLIEGSLNLQVLRAALRDVSDRYEILRTTFRCPHGMTIPLQWVERGKCALDRGIRPEHVDPSRHEAEIEALFQEVGRVPFDLANGPVLRISLLTLAADAHMLLVSAPSLCADAASLRILVREISRRYSAFARCQEPSGDLTQYADLAEWENELVGIGRNAGRKKTLARSGSLSFPRSEASLRKATFRQRRHSSPGF